MKYISVCSGIEAATVAWHPLGWKPVAFAEIEKFPSAVLAHHYPDVPNAGDFTAIQNGDYEPIELLVGGTPCQDFSVAGLRAGMDGARGQLTVEFAHLAGRLRPRWLVWENVPGVLSIDGGRAFGTFLGMLGQLGYGVAYRILDAQHFGVPQRRRRVFVVGYLGDWRRSAAVLFERHSLSGHPAPCRAAGKRVAPSLSQSLRSSGGIGMSNQELFSQRGAGLTWTGDGAWPAEDPAICMSTGQGSAEIGIGIGIGIGTTLHCGHEAPIVTHALCGEGFDASEDGTGRGTPRETLIAFSSKDHGADAGHLSPTLRSMGHDGSHANGGGQVAVAIGLDSQLNGEEEGIGPLTIGSRTGGGQPARVAVAIQNATRGQDQNGLGISEDGTMYTLDQGSQHGVAVAFESRFARNGRGSPSDIVPPLKAQSGETGKGDAAPLVAISANQRGEVREREAHGCLAGSKSGKQFDGIMQGMAVRRLTPREWERLQGFEDDYTKISDKTADGPRYKSLGNSMAVPVMAWIGTRIQMVENMK